MPAPKLASGTPEDLLRRTFEANFFGPALLTQLLLPLLRRSRAGRIVNLSGIRGSLSYQPDRNSPAFHKAFAYDSSKTALNAFTVQLAEELRDTTIKVNSIHPGWVRTKMGSEAADLSMEEGARTAILYATLSDDGPTGGFSISTTGCRGDNSEVVEAVGALLSFGFRPRNGSPGAGQSGELTADNV